MPRDSAGNYTLPAGNPVVSGTIIASTWANTTMPDLANEMTQSLSRSGQGGMLAPLKHTDGSNALPSVTFNNDLQSGLYLSAVDDVRMTVNTNDVQRWIFGDSQLWDGAQWNSILTTSLGGSAFFPGDDPDLTGVNAAVVIGNDDPDTEQHIEIGPTTIQAKADGTDGDEIKINPEDGSVRIGPNGGGVGRTYLYHDGALALETQNSGLKFTGVGDGDGFTHVFEMGNGTDAIDFITNQGAGYYRWQHELNGLYLHFIMRDGGGNQQECLRVDPDIRGITNNPGIISPRITLEATQGVNLSTDTAAFQLGDDDTVANLIMDRQSVQARDNGSFNRLQLNPYDGEVFIGKITGGPSSGEVNLFSDSTAVAQTTSASSGGLLVNNTLTGAGLERVLTESDAGGGGVTPPPVAGATAWTYGYTYQIGNINTFSVHTLITEDTWESVGPTGFADNDWSALDSLPVTATSITVYVQMLKVANAGENNEEANLYSRGNGFGGSPGIQTEVAKCSSYGLLGESMTHTTGQYIELSLDDDNIFDLRWGNSGLGAAQIILSLRGYKVSG